MGKRKYTVCKYDLVVVGAGLSGMTAAISAARNGAKVALIGNRPVLGGNASVEIGIDINGACYNSLYSPSVYARETGIIEEIKQEIFHRAGYESFKSASYNGALFDAVFSEKNIDLYLNTQAVDVSCKEGRLESVDCVQLTTEKRFRFVAPLFADCSGDGAVGAMAGADFTMGSEGRDEFGESLAPPHRTDFVNGATLMFTTVNTGKPEKYVAPKFAYDVTKLSFFKDLGTKHRTFYRSKSPEGGYQGFWWVEFGGHLDMISDSENIAEELRKLVYGLWDYIKNSGKFEGVEDAKLMTVGSVLGKRESRRFTGDHILTQKDILKKEKFPDACFAAGWPMDIHANYGIYDKDNATYWNFVPGMYNVPFSSMYSRNIENLFFAGRTISCTRIASGSTRVMATCAAGGQAVGAAAALCGKYGCTPRELREKHIGELQKLLLRQDQTLTGYREETGVKNLRVRASSEKRLENPAKEYVKPLEKAIVLALPISGERLDCFYVSVRNGGRPARLTYSVLEGDLKECYLPERRVKSGAVDIAAGFDGDVRLEIGCFKGKDEKVYILFDKNEQLSLYMTHETLTGAPSFTCWEKTPDERDPRRFVMTRLRENVSFKGVLPEQTGIFSCENVFSGYNRPYGLPNLWLSEGKEGEHLEAAFDEEYVKEIRLVFDTDLAEDIVMTQAKSVIKAYRLTVRGKEFEKTFDVEENFHRINRLEVDGKIGEIIFEPKENYGAERFGLFGIKIYRD